MLSLEKVSMRYDTQEVLENISFSAGNGEICSFIGPSGCGKSTMLNILAGNIRQYTGVVSLKGGAIDHRAMSIGLIAQDYGLLPWKTVLGNIVLPLKIKRLKVADYKQKIDFAMEKLGISQLSKRYPNQLSGGQKQRVAIAKTFIMDLNLLLMDEPFSALDAITREETQEFFLDIWQQNKPCTLFVTHSIEEAVFLGTKIFIFSHSPGKIVAEIANPAFLKSRADAEFFKTCSAIREIIQKEWGGT